MAHADGAYLCWEQRGFPRRQTKHILLYKTMEAGRGVNMKGSKTQLLLSSAPDTPLPSSPTLSSGALRTRLTSPCFWDRAECSSVFTSLCSKAPLCPNSHWRCHDRTQGTSSPPQSCSCCHNNRHRQKAVFSEGVVVPRGMPLSRGPASGRSTSALQGKEQTKV